MNYADIAVLAVLLIAVIIGCLRGFWKSVSKILSLGIAVVLAFTLADKLSTVMFNESALETLSSFVSNIVPTTPLSDAMVFATTSGDLMVEFEGGSIAIAEALKRMLVPSFLHAPIIASAGAIAGPITLGVLITSAYTHMLALVLSGLVIFLAAFIVVSIICAVIYKAVSYGKFHKAVDRILGGVLRIFTGGLFIVIVFNIMASMSGFEFMTPVMTEIENGVISGWIYKADLLNKIFYGEGMTKLIGMFENVIGVAGSGNVATSMCLVRSLFI